MTCLWWPRDTNKAGISQAITFLRPLFPVTLTDGPVPGVSLDGTPTDCVKLALEHLCPFKPDLIISGINGGLNIGVNLLLFGYGWRRFVRSPVWNSFHGY